MARLALVGLGERARSVKSAIDKLPDWSCVAHIAGLAYWKIGGPFLDINSPEIVEHFRSLDLDLVIVANWPQKIRRPMLDVPKHGVWNCHAGPVPEYRGGSPLNWQIIDGHHLIGLTLMRMDEGLDTGPIIEERWFQLGRDETISNAHFHANRAFREMVVQALQHFPPATKPQPPSDAYRRQRTDEDGRIDLENWDAKRIHDFVRALTHPYPGAWFHDRNGTKVRIWSTSLENEPQSTTSENESRSPVSATAS